MNKRKYIKVIIGLTIAVFSACKAPQPEKAPNLVYVFPDQFRKTAMAFWDTPKYKGAIRTKADPVITPQLDQFASEAMVFTRMVSNCPLCSPHRGSLMTGLFPGSSGVMLNCNATRPISSLRTDVVCFSDVLHNSGYETAYIGKWHLDYPTPNDPVNPGNYVDPRVPAWDTYTPQERRHGFNYWYSYGTWDVHKNPHYYDKDGNRYDPKEYSPMHEANKAIKYLKNEAGERDPDKPFALFISMNPPHSPYSSLADCLEEDYNLYKDIPIDKLLHRENADLQMRKVKSAPYYFANVTGVDREFGRIIEQLKEMGEYDNTIIVFTSDHGETMCSQGIRDPKNSIYTEAFDIPFLIRWPGMSKPAVSNLLIGSPDIMPTLLGLMGLGDKTPASVQGFDYSDALQGVNNAQRPTSALYIRNIDGEKDSTGLVVSYFPVARGIKTHQYTLEFTIDRDYQLISTKFFNDQEDPYQLNNLPVEKDNPVIQSLVHEMAFWLKRSEDPWYKNQILNDWIQYSAK